MHYGLIGNFYSIQFFFHNMCYTLIIYAIMNATRFMGGSVKIKSSFFLYRIRRIKKVNDNLINKPTILIHGKI